MLPHAPHRGRHGTHKDLSAAGLPLLRTPEVLALPAADPAVACSKALDAVVVSASSRIRPVLEVVEHENIREQTTHGLSDFTLIASVRKTGMSDTR